MYKGKNYNIEFLGRKLNVTLDFLAPQASASLVISYGESVILATIVIASSIREGIDYFPLMVDFEERFYAAGRIKKSRFVKKEGRPTDEAVVSARMIDRSIRPLFNQNIRNDVQVIITCLSADNENDLDILGIFGASLVSSIVFPDFRGPIAPLRIGYVDSKFIFNPTYQEREKSLFDLVFIKTKEDLVPMIDFEGKEVPERLILGAIKEGFRYADILLNLQEKIIKDYQDKNVSNQILVRSLDKKMVQFSETFLFDKIKDALYLKEKPESKKKIEVLKERFMEDARLKFSDFDSCKEELDIAFHDFINKTVHKNAILHGLRPDGRKLDEIRKINTGISILPRTHGSGLFMRGLTQTLSILTLAGPRDAQILESMEIIGEKRFFHHYNFLPFSTGEVWPLRGPGRREIGHGFLAEKSIEPMLPSKEEFPYTIRIVSEIVSSNGSTSMASVCSSSLALFDGGVPIKKHVAGISIGLMADEKFKDYVLLTDIQGPEDHFGDMDFKVAGTLDGINAIQLDVKNKGINFKIIEEALEKAKEARKHIIGNLSNTIKEHKKSISFYAPQIEMLKIGTAKIKDLIGPGGRNIQGISLKTKSEIDVKDDGTVYITSIDRKLLDMAKKLVEDLTKEYKIGDMIEGDVVRVEDYGAFVKIANGIDGLIHVSNMGSSVRLKSASQLLRLKDRVKAEIINIDEQNRIALKLIKK